MADESRGGGFRQIGDPAKRALASLSQRDAMTSGSSERGPGAEIITSARGMSSPTLTPLGAHGSETLPALSRRISELLAGSDPEATDEAILRSLPPSIASSLSPVERTFIDPVYGYDFELEGYKLQAQPIAEDDLKAAHSLLQRCLSAPSPQVIKTALAKLRAATRSRAEDEGDLAMTMQVLGDECAEYPPDVVRAACLRWMRREKWFPSLSELRDEMQRLVRRRQLIAEALHPRGEALMEARLRSAAMRREMDEEERRERERGLDAI